MSDSLSRLDNAKQLLQQSKLTESLAIYRTLVDEGAYLAEAHYGIGYILLKTGDVESASAEFLRCVKAEPQNANATYYLGLIAERTGQPDVARAYYERT